MPIERQQVPIAPLPDPVAPPPPPPAELGARRTEELILNQWDHLARQQVIPSPLGQTAAENIELKPRKMDADRRKEKEKKKKKRVIQEWQRGLWFRRALVKTKDKAKEKAEDKDKSKTARGLWKVADVAIGLALATQDRALIMPGNKTRSTRRYGPL